MKKRTISIVLAVCVVITAAVSLVWYVFPERYFVSRGTNGIASVKVTLSPYRNKHTVLLTEPEDIQSFCDALKHTSSLKLCLFVDHLGGVYSTPVYKLEVRYTNGKTVKIRTSEGGERIIRFLDPLAEHGEHSYYVAENEALLDWVKSVAFS